LASELDCAVFDLLAITGSGRELADVRVEIIHKCGTIQEAPAPHSRLSRR